MTEEYSVFCDGGARGNPGPAGTGFVVYGPDKKVLIRAGKFIGNTTNNVAEYTAVIEALSWFKKEKDTGAMTGTLRIRFFLDSMLVVNQLNGLFKIKKGSLRGLAIKVRELENLVNAKVSYHFVPREKNKIADTLVNQSVDEQILITAKKSRNT
jgi:ribonuclease HI